MQLYILYWLLNTTGMSHLKIKKNTTFRSRELTQGQRIIPMQIRLQSLLSSTMSGDFVSSHQMSLEMIAADSNTDVLAWQLLLLYPILLHISALCLTTGPKPHPKPVLRTVRSSASSFTLQYPLVYLKSSSSCLRLLCRLPLTSIFPPITCFRRQDVTNPLKLPYFYCMLDMPLLLASV